MLTAACIVSNTSKTAKIIKKATLPTTTSPKCQCHFGCFCGMLETCWKQRVTRTFPQCMMIACSLHARRQHVCCSVSVLWNELLVSLQHCCVIGAVILVQYAVQRLNGLPYLFGTNTSQTEHNDVHHNSMLAKVTRNNSNTQMISAI